MGWERSSRRPGVFSRDSDDFLREREQGMNSHDQWLGSTFATGCRARTGTVLESKVRSRNISWWTGEDLEQEPEVQPLSWGDPVNSAFINHRNQPPKVPIHSYHCSTERPAYLITASSPSWGTNSLKACDPCHCSKGKKIHLLRGEGKRVGLICLPHLALQETHWNCLVLFIFLVTWWLQMPSSSSCREVGAVRKE